MPSAELCEFTVLTLCVLFLPTVTVELSSCIDTGHRTCCTSGACEGEPPICYCDVLCHVYGDCCSDITEICPQTQYCSSNDVGMLRLGRGEENGTALEICRNNVWGVFCVDDSWDDNAAVVTCRQLGYETGGAFVSYFEDTPVHLVQYETNCSGLEGSLLQCGIELSLVQSNCRGHPGVLCQGCTDGDIQLVDGYINGGREGRLQICLNNTWGSLCSDSWDDMDARVACRQLGYFAESSVAADFGRSDGLVHHVEVQCSGTEMALSECLGDGESGSGLSLVPVNTDPEYCSNHAGVICEATCRAAGIDTCCESGCDVPFYGCSCDLSCPFSGNCCRDFKLFENCSDPVCNETDVRLVGGTDGLSGRVEICLLGQWGTVCDYFWDNDDAAVVCRQLGLESTGAFAERRAAFGVGDGRILLDEVLCTGEESRLVDCQHLGVGIHFCSSTAIAGVICPSLCLDGNVRLVDGFSNSSGRVEVCFAGIWGTVCDNSWDNTDASVVCKQLGLNGTNALGVSGIFPAGVGLILLNNVGCTGEEEALAECALVIGPIHSCTHTNDAEVICRQDLNDIEAVNVGFEQLVYIFQEGAMGNEACIATNGTLMPDINRIFLDIQSEDISTTSNSDYNLVSVHEALTTNRKCITAEIHANDLDCESDESFLLRLDVSIGREFVNFVHPTATIVIMDSGSLISTTNSLYPSGQREGDTPLQLQPNGLAPPFVLSQAFPFFGTSQSTLFVDPNGILSFQSPASSRPVSFPAFGNTAIALLWMEVEYSRLENIYYRETSEWCLLERAHKQVKEAFTSAQSFFPTALFIATWQVFPPLGTSEVYNRFQVVLASDGEVSYTLLIYEMIQWGERNDFTAGFNAGDGARFESLTGPLAEDSNVGISGVYIYRVDLPDVLNPTECADGDIRRLEDLDGLIEICVSNTWARLCAESLEQNEAEVACQQLGFSAENASILSSGVTDESVVLMSHTNCSGEENKLFDCLTSSVPVLNRTSCDYSILSCTAVTLSLTQDNYTVGEGDGSVTVCAVLNQTIKRMVVIRLATVEAAVPSSGLNQAKANRDYTTTLTEFSFRPTTGQQLQCADITIIDDATFERTETLLVVLSSPNRGVQLDPQYAFITILDNDVVAVQFATASNVVGEQAGSVSLCLEKVGEAEVDFEFTLTTLEVTTGDSAAEAGEDFVAVNETVVFAAGSNRIFRIILILDDKIGFEENEQFLIELTTSESGVEAVTNGNPTTVTIMDNDKVLLEFADANFNATEDSGNVTVCVRKDLEVAKEFSVTVMSRERSPVDAKDGEDFYAIAMPLVFPPGNTNTVCQNFGIIDDDVALEANEQFSLDLLVPLTITLQGSFELGLSINCMMVEEESTVDSSTVTIIDSDVLVLSFTSAMYEVNEDAGSVSVCIEKDKDAAAEVVFNIIADESDPVEAKSSQDFIAISELSTFPPGDQHQSCIDIQILDGTLALEGDEHFLLQFSLLLTHNVIIGQPNTSYVIIIDNDDLTVQFTQSEYEVLESEGSVVVCLEKDKDTAVDIVATITASEAASSTATASEDFEAIERNVSFASNESRVCIDITIHVDDIVENEEYFVVWFDISSDVRIIPGVNSSLVIITEMRTDEQALPVGGISGAAVAVVICMTIIVAVTVVLVCIVRHKRLRQKLQRHRTSLTDPNQKGIQNPYVMFRRPTRLSVMSTHLEELPDQVVIPSSMIRLLDSIGEGEFGMVYKAHIVWPKRTETVAVKTLKGFFDQNQINDMLKESLKMWQFNHPNVLTMIGVCIDGGPAPYIVMPFMSNGSLLSYLKKERSNLILTESADEDVIFSTSKKMMDMCFQVAKGMEYLASQKFVHKDLAARNCMIDLHFIIKIADFGLSENIYDRNYVRQGKDTAGKLPVKWMALESLLDLVFSEKTDVWAFGITCWEVFSGGRIPYPAVDPVSLPGMLQSGYRAEKPNNAACSEDMYSVMLQCWKENPEERPQFSELVTSISQQLEAVAGYMDVVTFGVQQDSALHFQNRAAIECEEQNENGRVGSGDWKLGWPELYH